MRSHTNNLKGLNNFCRCSFSRHQCLFRRDKASIEEHHPGSKIDVLEDTFGGRMSSAPCIILNQKTRSYVVDSSLAKGMAQIRFFPSELEDKELGVSPYAFHATCSHPMHFLSRTRKAAVDRLKSERRDTCHPHNCSRFAI